MYTLYRDIKFRNAKLFKCERYFKDRLSNV